MIKRSGGHTINFSFSSFPYTIDYFKKSRPSNNTAKLLSLSHILILIVLVVAVAVVDSRSTKATRFFIYENRVKVNIL